MAAMQALGMIETKGLVAAIEASVHVIPRPHDEVEAILPTLGR